MISPIRSAPRASPISAKVMLIENVGAVAVRVWEPEPGSAEVLDQPARGLVLEPAGNSLSGV